MEPATADTKLDSFPPPPPVVPGVYTIVNTASGACLSVSEKDLTSSATHLT